MHGKDLQFKTFAIFVPMSEDLKINTPEELEQASTTLLMVLLLLFAMHTVQISRINCDSGPQ